VSAEASVVISAKVGVSQLADADPANYTRSRSLFLQPTGDMQSLVATDSVTIQPSNGITKVEYVSRVDAADVQRMQSATAIAISRRRRCGEIHKMVLNLGQHVAAPDFHTFVHRIAEALSRVYRELLEYDYVEGNSCMILRYLRNSIQDGGWEKYREAHVRSTVSGLTNELATALVVEANMAERAFKTLYDVGLQPAVVLNLSDVFVEDSEEEAGDAATEDQVLG
jgi:hypothetical protein